MAQNDASLIAKRYATAVYDLAVEKKKLDAVAKDIKALQNMPTSADFNVFLTNPRIAKEDRIAAVKALSKKVKLNALTTQFLGVIADNGRLAILPEIVDTTARLIAEQQGEIVAEVTSARPLGATQVKNINAALKKMMGQDVELSLNEDPSILGGLVVKVGSLMIDQSVATRLDRLERALKSDAAHGDKTTLKNAA